MMVEIMKKSIPRNLKNYVIIDFSCVKRHNTKYCGNFPPLPPTLSPQYYPTDSHSESS